ncbi:hypothetical protein SAMN06295912_11957 [Sphingomonas laterariae]|uniref:Uncharacterized protein n=1 Tax=Edaphosphingomonas laterariae TaxID=861865 RepID=A0A239HVM1_9SPHN|nr:hypothetical protein [Sphingomonas laterariae]SNS85312.1 hypothetical protein SAMN06295912_11957 [Sphingomonas laterariae]
MAGNDNPPAIAGRLRHKVIGNGLRELDRFLSVLIDEVAMLMPPDDIDAVRVGRQRNTANKLRTLHTALGRSSPDHDRLRALGRSRDCLFYCDGVVTRSDRRHGTMMTIGWPCGENQVGGLIAVGERLVITPADLASVCGFYDRLGGDLVGVHPVPGRARLPLAPMSPISADANVACDGT